VRQRSPGSTWDLAGVVVAAAAAGFVVVFGSLVLYNHAHFGTQTFDLGIFDQGLWLLSRLERPFVTLRGVHLFGDHSSWILALLAPLYRIWPDVRVLLVLPVPALAASGPLLYRIARTEGVGKPLAAAVAVGFLLHPAVAWQAWDVFHPEVLAVPLLLAGYLLAARGHPGRAAVVLGLVLLVKEDAALVVVPLAVYLGLRFRTWKAMSALAAGGVAVFLFDVLVALPHFSPTGHLLYTGRYGRFGETLGSAIGRVLTSPGEVLSVLAEPQRVVYLVAMTAPLAVALLAPELLVVAVPITVANLLSSHGYQASIHYHYAAYFLAVVGLAAVRGATRLRGRRFASPRPVVFVAGGLVVVALAANLVAGPWPTVFANTGWGGTTDNPAAIREAMAMVPGDAVVAADWAIAPHMAHRRRIYMFPNPFVRVYWSAGADPPPPSETVEWVIVRVQRKERGASIDEEAARALAIVRDDPTFEEVVANDWVLLFHRRS